VGDIKQLPLSASVSKTATVNDTPPVTAPAPLIRTFSRPRSRARPPSLIGTYYVGPPESPDVSEASSSGVDLTFPSTATVATSASNLSTADDATDKSNTDLSSFDSDTSSDEEEYTNPDVDEEEMEGDSLDEEEEEEPDESDEEFDEEEVDTLSSNSTTSVDSTADYLVANYHHSRQLARLQRNPSVPSLKAARQRRAAVHRNHTLATNTVTDAPTQQKPPNQPKDAPVVTITISASTRPFDVLSIKSVGRDIAFRQLHSLWSPSFTATANSRATVESTIR